MNKIALVLIAALLLAAALIFISLPSSNMVMPASNSSNSSTLIGVIGSLSVPISSQSLSVQNIPSVNYSLEKYDVIVVDNMTYCSLALRFSLAEWVRNGGKLIVIGDACTQVPNDPASIGWNVGVNSLGSVMPVVFGGVTPSFNYTQLQETAGVGNGTIEIVDYSSFAFSNVSDLAFSGNSTVVYPSVDGKVLSLISFPASYSNQVENQTFYAIVQSENYGVFYLSFEPQSEPQIFNNLISGLAK